MAASAFNRLGPLIDTKNALLIVFSSSTILQHDFSLLLELKIQSEKTKKKFCGQWFHGPMHTWSNTWSTSARTLQF